MTYPDNSANSVHSLLALLRSAQDGSIPSQSPASASIPIPQSQSAQASHRSPNQQQHPRQSISSKPAVPSKRQLDDLLSSLNARGAPSLPAGNGEEKKQRLIEPFGPVGEITSPSKPLYDPQNQNQNPSQAGPSRRQSDTSASTPNHGRQVTPTSQRRGSDTTRISTPIKSKLKPSERVNEEGYGSMSFSKALPILSESLGDDGFKAELKKLKKEQDALERRLWAKGEKIKAEHERSIQPEKEVAKIARKVIPPEKKEAWAKSLSTLLDTFYLEQCLPAIDGLATKQRQRLVELGVPGLGNDGEKGKDRVKRIMELLEAGLEE
ncbi:uncharacterized protein I303_106092 [Kwoniella dejecticola CBS 10117]|uniref:Uncharacterized protein n=1 Tax=Kwoniella dejecticola CBS 10117 TaxID=1296121 RepID=A0A1A6A192_9TREE|nr:uncharacterized protein I303_06111 [Kwoniella dejecticola CBS 10117]OBR83828.1 hypothetical protein I303_06111 [Kwoniella dejecticola CBS 10117]